MIGFSEPQQYQQAREAFQRAGYNETQVSEHMQGQDGTAPIALELPDLVISAQGGSDLETLTRLFLFSLTVESEAFARAVHPMSVDAWVTAGIVRQVPHGIAAVLKLAPFGDLIVASDRKSPGQADPDDFVMGIAGSSLTLTRSTIRRPSTRTLDIGTGCGIQSFLAAAHSDHVTAIDCNPRALQLAEFNKQLNRIDNIDFRAGNLFESVQGEQFDLIVCNPPFVISPEFRATFRDSGMAGDGLCRNILQQAPSFLTPGGYCQLLCNWAQHQGQAWQERLATWFQGNQCDVWVMRGKIMEPREYTMFWNADRKASPDFGNVYRQWMEFFQQEGIESIGVGIITMRRSSQGRSAFRAEDAPPQIFGPIGNDLATGFELFDFLQAYSDDQRFLPVRLRLSPNVVLRREYTPSEQGWAANQGLLCRTSGLGYRMTLPDESIRLLDHCNCVRTVAEMVEELARLRQTTAEKVQADCLRLLRNLVGRGFVLPVA